MTALLRFHRDMVVALVAGAVAARAAHRDGTSRLAASAPRRLRLRKRARNIVGALQERALCRWRCKLT